MIATLTDFIIFGWFAVLLSINFPQRFSGSLFWSIQLTKLALRQSVEQNTSSFEKAVEFEQACTVSTDVLEGTDLSTKIEELYDT